MDFDDLDDAVGGRAFHLVVYGATGYTGCLICEHLDALLSLPDAPPYRWAVAGRNKKKLDKLASKCKSSPEVIVACDRESLEAMAESCSVVVNAAGPYILSGTTVVKACVEKKTHYIDVTGELVWMRRMIDYHHKTAKELGIMIIHAAGVMCAPEDLGLYLLAKKLGPLAKFQLYQMEGGVAGTGGSFLSGYAGYEDMTSPELEILIDPFSLGGVRKVGRRKEDEDPEDAVMDQIFPDIWLAPGHSTACAHRVLRRSCELFDADVAAKMEAAPSYGEQILITSRYAFSRESAARQRAATNKEPRDIKGLMKHAETMKKALERGQAIPPGYGPNRKERGEEGFMNWFAVAQGESGEWAHVRITGPDALEATAMCIVAGAFVLLDEADQINQKDRGGVLTPAYAFHGSTFVDRVTSKPFAGIPGRDMRFSVHDGKPELDALQKAAKECDAKADAVFARSTSKEGIPGAVDVPDLLK
eukprot:TRINITY_DN88737_c0_g1_i1.p1 TRINITY_DN88737_c0_g1~~TRINITY_DN88737_c0_g1_i1.p1  ORF type:complete len:474 (-),score=87.72 TRINITY_DN88737_c0_g1_i1:65-1486(-)